MSQIDAGGRAGKEREQVAKEREKDDASRREFLAHLRTVHFSLITTCFLLLIGASQRPSQISENAYQQAREIRATYASLDAWVRHHYDPWIPSQIYEKVWRDSPVFNDGKVSYQALRGTVEGVSGGVGVFDLDSLRRSRLYGPPSANPTLMDFRNRWEALEAVSRLSWVTGWDRSRIEIVPDSGPPGRYGRGRLPYGPVYQFANEIEEAKLVEEGGLWSLVLTYTNRRKRVPGDTLQLHVLPIRAMRIPLEVSALEEDFQVSFIHSRMLHDWKPGSFEESFPDLAVYAEDITSLSLADLEKFLEKRSREQLPSITLFGASLPADSLRLWGVVVLLVLQGYLAFYIHHFRQKWTALADPSFAWIGSYQGLMSRNLFYSSVSLLPFSTTLLLWYTGLSFRLSAFLLATLFMAAFVSGLLAVTLWYEVRQGDVRERRKFDLPGTRRVMPAAHFGSSVVGGSDGG
jgi:hypothetical protein